MKTLIILCLLMLTLTNQKRRDIQSDFIEEEDFIDLNLNDELNIILSSRKLGDFFYKTHLEDSSLQILEKNDQHVLFKINKPGLTPIKLRRETIDELTKAKSTYIKTIYVNVSSSRFLI